MTDVPSKRDCQPMNPSPGCRSSNLHTRIERWPARHASAGQRSTHRRRSANGALPANVESTRWLARDSCHILRCRALLALHDVELHRLALGEGLEAFALNGRMVDEAILLSVGGRDE